MFFGIVKMPYKKYMEVKINMKRKKTLAVSMLLAISVVAIAGVLLSTQMSEPFIQNEIYEEQIKIREKWVPQVGDADPGSGNSGFMYFMAYPHQADPGTTYASNLSNATAYEFLDSWDGEMTGETPYSTTFDFVMKVRVNNTDGYNTSSWEDDWVKANISVDFDYASDVSDLDMTEIVIGTQDTTYRWYHYYINNGGSGYTITKGESYNCTAVNWYVYE